MQILYRNQWCNMLTHELMFLHWDMCYTNDIYEYLWWCPDVKYFIFVPFNNNIFAFQISPEENAGCQMDFKRIQYYPYCPQRMPSQIARFAGTTWGLPGCCRPQVGPMLALWTLLSEIAITCKHMDQWQQQPCLLDSLRSHEQQKV